MNKNKKIYLFLILGFLFFNNFSFGATKDVDVNINNQGFLGNQSYSGSININGLDVLNNNSLNKILNLIINVNSVEQIIASGDIYADPNPIIVDPGQIYTSTTIYAKSSVNYDILVASSDNINNAVIFVANQPSTRLGITRNFTYVTYPTGNWVTNGTTFYLVKSGTKEILDKIIIEFKTSLTASGDIYADPNPIIVDPGQIYTSTTIYAKSSVNYDILVASSDNINNAVIFQLNQSSNNDYVTYPTGNWVTNGTTFYLVKSGTKEILDKIIISFNTKSATLTINNQTSGSFNVGDSWILKVQTNPILANKSVQICAIKNITSLGCTYYGNTDSNGSWSLSGTFDSSVVGSWNEYAIIDNKINSNNISFIVSDNNQNNQNNQTSTQQGIFTIIPSSVNLLIGQYQQFRAYYDPDGNGPQLSQDVTNLANWSSSNSNILSINNSNQKGLAIANNTGLAIIYVSYNSYFLSAIANISALNSTSTSTPIININNSPSPTSTNPLTGGSVNPPPPQKHLECNSSNQCVEVNGSGPNRCSVSSDCGPTITFAGKCELQNGARFCVNKRCNPSIPGDCISQCKNDSDCGNNLPPQTHLKCYNNACVIVSGLGTNQCSRIGLGCQGTIKEINPTLPKINPPPIFDFLRNTASIFFTRIK